MRVREGVREEGVRELWKSEGRRENDEKFNRHHRNITQLAILPTLITKAASPPTAHQIHPHAQTHLPSAQDTVKSLPASTDRMQLI